MFMKILKIKVNAILLNNQNPFQFTNLIIQATELPKRSIIIILYNKCTSKTFEHIIILILFCLWCMWRGLITGLEFLALNGIWWVEGAPTGNSSSLNKYSNCDCYVWYNKIQFIIKNLHQHKPEGKINSAM